MTFGLYKKLKDGFHKARKFINYNIIKPAIESIKKVKPILEKVDLNKLQPILPSNIDFDKINKYKQKAIEFSDDIINLDDKLQQNDYEGAITYAGHKFIPRLKRK